MRIFRTLDAVEMNPSACAMGMFDGIHLGHHMVLEQALRQAKIQGLESVVFTFANHPQTIVSQTPTPLLSTYQDRVEAFSAFGFDAALILDFTHTLKDLPAETFVQQILVNTLKVKAVSIGYDHRFGKDRLGDGAFLKAQGEHYGFSVDIVEPVHVDHQIVSSTLIRKLLSYGELEQANQLLGHPYTLSGQVISGEGRGRQIGFPTANIALPPDRLVPAIGVYAGYALRKGSDKRYPAVCNIGNAPTFGATQEARIEIHLLGETIDLYSETLCFEFHHHLRSEQTFPSVNALIQQIQLDCSTAKQLMGVE